jgi:putative transposase
MTETLLGVSPPPSNDPAGPPSAEELAAAKELVRQARAQGVALTGPGGLLKALTKTVIETALEAEMSDHLGYDCEDVGRGSEAGLTRAKTGRSALCLICRPASGRLCRLPGEGRVSIGAFRPFAPSQS